MLVVGSATVFSVPSVASTTEKPVPSSTDSTQPSFVMPEGSTPSGSPQLKVAVVPEPPIDAVSPLSSSFVTTGLVRSMLTVVDATAETFPAPSTAITRTTVVPSAATGIELPVACGDDVVGVLPSRV